MEGLELTLGGETVEIPEEEETEEVTPADLTLTKSSSSMFKTVAEDSPRLKMLLFGDPGVGKTVLAAQAPGAILIDAEHGSLSLNNHKETRDVPRAEVTSWEQVEEIFWDIFDGDPWYDDKETIVIDSYTELQKRNLDDILRKEAAADPSRSAYRATLPQYGENGQVMRRLAVNFRDLKKNLIITAHAIEDKDESSGALVMRPAVSPKLSETLIGMMDIVGYMTIEDRENENGEIETVRFLQVHPSRNVRAKCRVGGLPRILENPTFQTLLDAKINSGKEDE